MYLNVSKNVFIDVKPSLENNFNIKKNKIMRTMLKNI